MDLSMKKTSGVNRIYNNIESLFVLPGDLQRRYSEREGLCFPSQVPKNAGMRDKGNRVIDPPCRHEYKGAQPSPGMPRQQVLPRLLEDCPRAHHERFTLEVRDVEQTHASLHGRGPRFVFRRLV
jgi:hypothetical protein